MSNKNLFIFKNNEYQRVVSDGGVKFELITTLGNITVSSDGGDTEAYFLKEDYVLPQYDLYIFTMNNSFIITPLSQTGQALCCGSFAYDDQGNSMIARLRFTKTSDSLTITFNTEFANAIYDSGITPSGMLLGVKLG